MAQGSHATRGGWEPTTCGYFSKCLYGGRLILTGPHALWFQKDDQTGEIVGVHMDCWRNATQPRPAAPVTSPAQRTLSGAATAEKRHDGRRVHPPDGRLS